MDNFGIKPTAMPLDVEDIEQEQTLDRQDENLARSYFHKDWMEVEKIFIEEIERLSLKPSPALKADEYKIQSLADDRSRSFLITLLGRVKDAVTATEQQKGVN